MPPRLPSQEELAEDFAEIKASLAALNHKLDRLDQRFVPRELYEAKHTSLRSEIALEMASLRAHVDQSDTGIRSSAESARTLSMWALGVLASAVVVALVGFLVAGAGGTT